MLKTLLSPKVGLLLIAIFSSVAFVNGQDGTPANSERRELRPRDGRRDIMAELGLSQEQKQHFRKLVAAHRPIMNAAQLRLREANRELDMAIYADTVSGEIVRARLKALQDAQAEVTRLRFINELDIRKLLTQEQLVKFRGMRDRQMRESGRPGDGMPRRDGPPLERQPDGSQFPQPAANQAKRSN